MHIQCFKLVSNGSQCLGPEVRGNHPGAFERLMQMEVSARAKQQVHPAMASPVRGGMYGDEVDMNLRYR
jgi:hypothetical protein